MRNPEQIIEHDNNNTESLDPFNSYPDFGRILDQMAEKGLHLYYYRVRNVFRDEGTKWRDEWENHIKNWMRKARCYDYISNNFNDEDTILSENVNNESTSHQGYDRIPIIMKIRKAFQAQKDLANLQEWLLLNALKYPPDFVKFIEGSLDEWKNLKSDGISTQSFEIAPKGTMERIKDLERIIDFIEKRTPIGKMDGFFVHPSEDLEFLRLCLRNIIGLSTDVRNLWSGRDVKILYQWTEMSKKLVNRDFLSKSGL